MFQAKLDAAGYGEITTEIAPAGPFFYAEPYHQQYLAKNPSGYCGLGGTGVSCPIGVTAVHPAPPLPPRPTAAPGGQRGQLRVRVTRRSTRRVEGPGHERPDQPQPWRRMSSPSASTPLPAQRSRPGVADRRATRPCIGVPSTSAIIPVAATCGSAEMSAMSITGPIAASAAANVVEHLAGRPGGDPVGHDGVELLAVLDPSGEGGEARIVADARAAASPEPATESDDVDRPTQRAVGAAVGPPRDGVGDARAEAGLLLAGQPVDARSAGP